MPATTAELMGSNGCPQLYQLNNIDVPAPVQFDLKLNDIDGDSKRNEYGDMVRIVIASDKRSYSCKWENLTIEEKNIVLQNTSSKFGCTVFPVRFTNEYDATETATFYRGTNVTITPKLILSAEEKYYDVSFDIIEV